MSVIQGEVVQGWPCVVIDFGIANDAQMAKSDLTRPLDAR